jgi:predicted dehydrogenase
LPNNQIRALRCARLSTKRYAGKITRARGSNCHSGSLGGWFDKEYRWMADPKIAGVGAFGDLGTHKLDILDAVTGVKDQPLVKPSEAASPVVVMEAMYRGARERKWISVG